MIRAVSEVNHVGTSRTPRSSPAWASQGTWGPNRKSRAVTKAGRKARAEKTPIEPSPWIKSGRLTGEVLSARRWSGPVLGVLCQPEHDLRFWTCKHTHRARCPGSDPLLVKI